MKAKSIFILLLILVISILVLAAASLTFAQQKEITIYYAQPRDLVEPVIVAFDQKYPDIKVNSFRAPGEELATIVELEARTGNIKMDCYFGLLPQLEGIQERHGLFRPYTPKNIDDIIEDMQVENFLFPYVATEQYVIHYNEKIISREEAPKSYENFLDPKWQNKIILADPLTSASIHLFVWFITEYLYEKYGEPYGWKYFEELAKLNPRLESSHGTVRDMVELGERPLAVQLLALVLVSRERGEPTWWSYPEEGLPTNALATAIVKDSPNQEEAELFANFLFSVEGQQLLIDAAGYAPVNKNVDFKFPDGNTLETIPYPLIPVTGNALSDEKRAERMEKFRDIMEKGSIK